MSKKSRKKKEGQDPSPEAVPAENTDSTLEPAEQSEIPAEGSEEIAIEEITAEITEVFEESEGSFEEGSELPEAVTEEALSGDVGDVPRLPHILEAILFASQKAVTPKELVAHLKNAANAEPNSAAIAFAKIRESAVQEALEELQAEVSASGRAYQVRETATGWLLSSAPGFAPWLRALYPEAKPTRLSPSALETLAIIAYRQPIARADMEAVRGVSVDGVMQTLLDRGLVKIAGRAEVPGRPLLYATTQYFLDHFGLRNLDELPNAAELRHIPLPRATPEPSQATPSDDSTPELPGVSDEFAAKEPEPLQEVHVSEIIEVRESVVFEEVPFDTESTQGEEVEEAPKKDPEA
jgi:segregation and condensation protein B